MERGGDDLLFLTFLVEGLAQSGFDEFDDRQAPGGLIGWVVDRVDAESEVPVRGAEPGQSKIVFHGLFGRPHPVVLGGLGEGLSHGDDVGAFSHHALRKHMLLFRVPGGIEEKAEMEASHVTEIGRALEFQIGGTVLIPAKCEGPVGSVDGSLLERDVVAIGGEDEATGDLENQLVGTLVADLGGETSGFDLGPHGAEETHHASLITPASDRDRMRGENRRVE